MTSFPSGSARVVALATALVVLAVAPPVRADVSSWLYAGSGPSFFDRPGLDPEVQPSLMLDTGLGSPPSDLISAGGLFRLHTHFGQGTDLALALRLATRGYVQGGWGVALDNGGYQRFWGIGSTGYQGTVSLGAPWGIVLNLTGSYGTNDQRTYAAVLGVDFARLTVYRTSGENWWSNPFPATREQRDPAAR